MITVEYPPGGSDPIHRHNVFLVKDKGAPPLMPIE